MEWDGIDRRSEGITLGVIKEMREWLTEHEKEEFAKHEAIREELNALKETTNSQHLETLNRISEANHSTLAVVNQQNAIIREVHSMFKNAFIDGDPVKHRLVHEHQEKREKEVADTWTKLKQHIINWAAVAIIGWGGVAIWLAFLNGPK